MEFFLLILFVVRVFQLGQGRTNFKVSKRFPIVYLVYTLAINLIVLIVEKYGFLEYEGEYIPFNTRFRTALIMFVLSNVTTPLFPLLEWLKGLKIKSLAKSIPASTVEKKP
jgi:hypothetical protein